MNDVDIIDPKRVISLVNRLFEPKSDPAKNKPADISNDEIKNIIQDQMPGKDLDKLVENIKKVIETSEIFNKQVTLEFNKDINRVIITVIDKNTDKVPREIPCDELQDLALRLQEAIGVLFDSKA